MPNSRIAKLDCRDRCSPHDECPLNTRAFRKHESSFKRLLPIAFILFATSTSGQIIELQTPTGPNRAWLTNGLVSHYLFEKSTEDLSGNAHHGKPVNITYTTNRFGQENSAITLNGTSSYVGIPYSADFNFPPDGQFTLSAWFKLGGPSSGTGGIGSLIVKGPSSGFWNYGLECPYQNKYVIWAGLHLQSPCISTNVLKLGSWYHAALTYSNAVWTLYLNGARQVRTNTSYKITVSGSGMAIGRKGDSAADYFKGAIDDVRVYKRAFSSSEVTRLYWIEAQPENLEISAVLPVFSSLQRSSMYHLQTTTNLSEPFRDFGPPFSSDEDTAALLDLFDLNVLPAHFFRIRLD